MLTLTVWQHTTAEQNALSVLDPITQQQRIKILFLTQQHDLRQKASFIYSLIYHAQTKTQALALELDPSEQRLISTVAEHVWYQPWGLYQDVCSQHRLLHNKKRGSDCKIRGSVWLVCISSRVKSIIYIAQQNMYHVIQDMPVHAVHSSDFHPYSPSWPCPVIFLYTTYSFESPPLSNEAVIKTALWLSLSSVRLCSSSISSPAQGSCFRWVQFPLRRSRLLYQALRLDGHGRRPGQSQHKKPPKRSTQNLQWRHLHEQHYKRIHGKIEACWGKPPERWIQWSGRACLAAQHQGRQEVKKLKGQLGFQGRSQEDIHFFALLVSRPTIEMMEKIGTKSKKLIWGGDLVKVSALYQCATDMLLVESVNHCV